MGFGRRLPLATFDFTKNMKGGGKGGDLMGFTTDKLFIVKEVNPGDQNLS